MEGSDSSQSAFALQVSNKSTESVHAYDIASQDTSDWENPNLTQLLQAMPFTHDSYGPLATLSGILCANTPSYSVLEIQQAYMQCWKLLPEDAKAGRGSNEARQLLECVLRQCKASYSSLLVLLHPTSSATAIIDPENGQSLQHDEFATRVRNFRLPLSIQNGPTKPIVAISLPNGPLLAMTVFAVSTYYTAAPIAHGNGVGSEQFKADILQLRSNIVLTSAADVSRLGLHDSWLTDAGIDVYLVQTGPRMEIELRDLNNNMLPQDSFVNQPVPSEADDIGLLLFTSGTSGTKKLVPLKLHSIVCGVSAVVHSWALNGSMRCLNQMPLNHVGGLVRNLFAPIMSGGSIICCSAFDANQFWDCVEDHAPTWYYASPTMHQCILEAGLDRPEAIAKSQIRLVCNAAGGLLPSLATRLRDTFSTDDIECTVLPSYGMTECMPISTPPLHYRLQRIGTSGISVGPEITILDGQGKCVESRSVGRICLRGAPLFSGYLKRDDTIDETCFNEDGWFDTGDMGYLDDEGYLYITGRSKEVINRGGELISPFEIEEAVMAASANPASPIYGRVSKALAFSVPHDILQEVVGIVITTPEGTKRPCLRMIQTSLTSSLAQVKMPELVVFMDGGLPTNNNKLLRIKLADRMALPQLSDSTPTSSQYFEAECPPPNTPLNRPVYCETLSANTECLEAACKALIPVQIEFHIQIVAHEIHPRLFLAPLSDSEIALETINSTWLMQKFSKILHGYQVPSKIQMLSTSLPRGMSGNIDDEQLEKLLHDKRHENASRSNIPTLISTEARIAKMFAQILSVAEHDLATTSDFFVLGGDSMKAGRLLSTLRKEFQIRLAIDNLFQYGQISTLATLINKKLSLAPVSNGIVERHAAVKFAPSEHLLPGCQDTYSSARPLLLLVQLLPLCIFYPMKRALNWTIFMYFLAYTQRLITNEGIPGRLLNLIISMAIARAVTKTVLPSLAIIFKWLVIGKYREGLYPMWGPYHTRWWMVQKVLSIAGFGIFAYFNWSRVLYYRCLGTKIGHRVTINQGAILGEYDLLSIDDDVVLDRCIIRPFAAERNTSMYLGRIALGAHSSIGLASIVSPGTVLPPNTCIGPNSSSWEVKDAKESNRDLSSSKIAGTHWTLNCVLGMPIQIIVTCFGAIPWIGCLVGLVLHEPKDGIGDELRQIIIWFASPERVAYHYLALAANATIGPLFLFAAVLCFKKCFDAMYGKIRPDSSKNYSTFARFRMQMIRTLMPAPRLHKLTDLFGIHYEATSVFMRAMGAKVGKNVYWPGTGPSIQDFDLLEIGDNVVFGSRSHLVTSDGNGSDSIRISPGSMVADRVVLLPGVELGENTVMGSGALTKRATAYPANTTWVGSKDGEAVCLSGNQSYIEKSIIPASAFASYNSSRATLVKQVRFNFTSSEASFFYDLEKDSNSSRDDVKILKPAMSTGGTHSAVTTRELKSAIDESRPELSSPFGRAFYEGLAPYRVWSQLEIFVYSAIITIATAVFWNVGSISAVQIVARVFKDLIPLPEILSLRSLSRPLLVYFLFMAINVGIMGVQSLVVLLFLISAKWVLMGRRSEGNHDWDKSPYCQRWQLFLKLESLRRKCYGGNGILELLTGTHWMVWYFRALGANIGKHCALFAGGQPSLMFTEPDLLTLGDRVTVDDASLVCHINTRGKFDLNPLYVGDRSVLRTGSRLLSGARMEADSCLLEHTLVMAGDIVEKACTSQGWPAEEFQGSRMPTLKTKQVWVKA